jgi:hypothetical protein
VCSSGLTVVIPSDYLVELLERHNLRPTIARA